MGIISKTYIKALVHRYDKEVGVPYFSCDDFKDLNYEENQFVNSDGLKITYFYYYFKDYRKDKTVLFCPGIGPGHTAYLNEIVTLARHGYKVLTLDYQGCDKSEGKILESFNKPTRDVIDLLKHLNLNNEVVLVGHSLGAYTALNVINLRKDINKAVIMSGFIDFYDLMLGFLKSKFVTKRVMKYEKNVEPEYFGIDNKTYLKNTKDKLLFIHSKDDNVVPYKLGLGLAEQFNNPNITTLSVDNRKHNPNYTDEAVKYFTEVFHNFYALKKSNKIKTDEDKIAYFKNFSIEKMVEQDPKIINSILDFIK